MKITLEDMKSKGRVIIYPGKGQLPDYQKGTKVKRHLFLFLKD
jgi:hypothetical protein